MRLKFLDFLVLLSLCFSLHVCPEVAFAEYVEAYTPSQCSEEFGVVQCEYKRWSYYAGCSPGYFGGTCYVWLTGIVWDELERQRDHITCPKGCGAAVPQCPTKKPIDFNDGMSELLPTMYSDKDSCMAAATRLCERYLEGTPSHWGYTDFITYSCQER